MGIEWGPRFYGAEKCRDQTFGRSTVVLRRGALGHSVFFMVLIVQNEIYDDEFNSRHNNPKLELPKIRVK